MKKFLGLTLAANFTILTIPLASFSQSPTPSQEWNYFGSCYSDDVIYANNGKWWRPRFGPPGGWIYEGKYEIITNGVIQVFSQGQPLGKTYIHRRLSEKKCKLR